MGSVFMIGGFSLRSGSFFGKGAGFAEAVETGRGVAFGAGIAGRDTEAVGHGVGF